MRGRLVRGVLWLGLLGIVMQGVARAEAPEGLFSGLGDHTRAISTKSKEAQAFFNQGLAFFYGFNHDEALRSFHRAAEYDPECAAIHYAIALTNGPHINYPLVDEKHAAAAWEALGRAQKFADRATAVERDLIAALAKRYADPQPEDRRPLDEAYAAAMRTLWEKYPRDADVGALFAEALMDLWPWDLWSAEGAPRPDTPEVVKTLETVLELASRHPLALHLYIHAMEASPQPEKAAEAADRLRDLQPALGHMVHMPSHIDVRLGEWEQAIAANEKSIVADAAYRKLSPDQDFFRLYMAHNHHMLAFAAIMQGRNERATRAIREMLDEIPDAWLEQNAPFVDGMYCMPYELHLRFGRWDEMLNEPEPREILPITRAFRHYARGVAYAAKGETAAARAEQKQFLAAKSALPDEAMFVQNPAADVLAVADRMLEGEILYREGKADEAIAALREAIAAEDKLRYIEPPDWIQPVRHVLGAVLMDCERFADAEQVFREDLVKHPHNGWSLHGLSRSLARQGKMDAAKAVDVKFRAAWKHADVQLTSSCFCLPGKE